MCITCILKGTKSNCIRRSSDRSTHTTKVSGNRDSQCKRNPSTSVRWQSHKYRSKERKHHRCCSCITHEHGKYTNDEKHTEEHVLGLVAERLEHHPRKLHIQPNLCCSKSKHESTEEEHDNRISECSHDTLVISHLAKIIPGHKESKSLIGCCQQNCHYSHYRSSPCWNYFKYPHHSCKHKNCDHTLLSQSENRKTGFRINAIERCRHQRQEKCKDAYHKKRKAAFEVHRVTQE